MSIINYAKHVLGRQIKKHLAWSPCTRVYARCFWEAVGVVVIGSIIFNQLPIASASRTASLSVPNIAESGEVASSTDYKQEVRKEVIRDMQDEIMDDLADKCESYGWGKAGFDSPDALITWDPDKTGIKENVPSYGRLQEKSRTVQGRTMQVFGKKVSDLEAQHIAQNYKEAKEIGRYMIFVEKIGHTTGGWFNCFNHHPELNLKSRVDGVLREQARLTK